MLRLGLVLVIYSILLVLILQLTFAERQNTSGYELCSSEFLFIMMGSKFMSVIRPVTGKVFLSCYLFGGGWGMLNYAYEAGEANDHL